MSAPAGASSLRPSRPGGSTGSASTSARRRRTKGVGSASRSVTEDVFTYLAGRTELAGLFLSHLVEHFEPARVDELIRVAAHALRPGGTIVIVTPNPGATGWCCRTSSGSIPTHVRAYPTELLAAMLETAGFTVEASGDRKLQLGHDRSRRRS